MEDFNHPDICWEHHTARRSQSRRFLQSIDDNFLTQVVEEPTTRGVLLEFVLKNRDGLVEGVKVWGSLAAVTMIWWSAGSCMEEAGKYVGSKHWTSEESTLAFSRTYLDESCGSGL